MKNEYDNSQIMTKQARLPEDSLLLPLSNGKLLVSRTHAVFCRVESSEVDLVQKAIDSKSFLAVNHDLFIRLEQHGFFGPPQKSKSDIPSVQLQLTNHCNLSCSYCCTNSGKARSSEIGFERWLQIVQEIPGAMGSNARVAILGGEPLLIPWSIDLASAILSEGLGLTIFTNGIPLKNRDLAERVAQLMERGAEVRVSLAGPSLETCDSFSGAERFEAVLAGLKQLASFNVLANIDLMLAPQNALSIGQYLPSLRKRLPAKTPIAFGLLYLSGRETGKELFSSRADLEKALDEIAFEAGEAIQATRRSFVAYRREGCVCALGQHVHVRSDGSLFSCFKMEEKIGHIDTLGFSDTAKLIRSKPHRASDLPTCKECPLATLCGGGCRSDNMLYTGDPDIPPCGYWRRRVISELLAEDNVAALEWPVGFLLHEARIRNIEAPRELVPEKASRHLIEV